MSFLQLPTCLRPVTNRLPYHLSPAELDCRSGSGAELRGQHPLGWCLWAKGWWGRTPSLPPAHVFLCELWGKGKASEPAPSPSQAGQPCWNGKGPQRRDEPGGNGVSLAYSGERPNCNLFSSHILCQVGFPQLLLGMENCTGLFSPPLPRLCSWQETCFCSADVAVLAEN